MREVTDLSTGVEAVVVEDEVNDVDKVDAVVTDEEVPVR